jgi:hypothetical protein
MDIEIEIFAPIANRIVAHSDSLKTAKKINQGGIEGWLKVEALAALGEKVRHVKNNGPDLELEGGIFVELKGMTNFSLSYIMNGLKYEQFPEYAGKTYCLFLANGDDLSRLALLEDKTKLICKRIFSDGNVTSSWVLGLVIPA